MQTEKSADGRQPAFWPIVVLFFAAIVVLTYFPTLAGKVPLPNDMVFRYPPWDGIAKPPLPSFATIGDLVTFVYPSRMFAARAVREGKLPLWNPYLSSGAPFVANSQSAVFYPPNVLGYVLPLPVAWSAGLMLRLFLAAVFMTMFMRSIGASRTGAVMAGMVFGWCGFNTSWQGFPMGDAAIWLPLMCYAVVRLYRSPDSAGIGLAALTFAMPLLAGHPETAAHISLAAMIFAALLSVLPGRAESGQSTRFLIRTTIAGFLALGVAAVQVLPTTEWIGQVFHLLNIVWPALPLPDALGIVSRDIQHGPNSAHILVPEAASYVGMMTLLAAPLAAFHSRKRYVLALAIITGLAFAAAFSVQPVQWLIAHIPVLKGIKNHRLILVQSFGLAALAGFGIAALQEGLSALKRRKAAILLAVVFCLSLGLVYTLQRHTAFRVSVMARPSFSRALLLVSIVPLIAAVSGRLRGRAFSIAVCGVAAFDLVTFSYGYTSFAESKHIFPPAPVFDFLNSHMDSNQYRVAALSGAYPVNAPIMYGIAAADGYDVPLQRTVAFNDGLRVEAETALQFTEDRILAAQDRRLDLMNVKYLVGKVSSPDFQRMRESDRFSVVFQAGDLAVFENKSVLPRAFAVPVSGIELLPDLKSQIARLSDRTFDPERSVITEARPVLEASTDAFVDDFTSHVEAGDHDFNAVTYRTQTSQPAVLIISQSYFPGWYATIDGKAAAVFAADHALTGVVVPAGMHEVRLYLNPLTFRVGAMLTIIAVLCAGALVLSGLAPRYELPLLQPLAVGTGVAALASVAVIVAANSGASRSNPAADMASRTQSIRLEFSKDIVLGTLPLPTMQTGYATMKTDSAVAAMALMRYSDGKVESEIVLPPGEPLTSGSIPFRLDGNYKTAVVIVNPGTSDAHVDLTVDAGSVQKTIALPAGDKLSVFLNDAPFRISSAGGTLNWRSDAPVIFSAIETFRDAAHPYLMAPLSVAASSSLKKEPLYLPFLSAGHPAGELILVNPTQGRLSGRYVRYTAAGERVARSPYSIGPNTSLRVAITDLQDGWFQVIPNAAGVAPDARLILSPNESQAATLLSIGATTATTAATLHVSASPAAPVRVIAVNPQASPADVTLLSEISIPSFRAVTTSITSAGTVEVRSKTPIALGVLQSRSVLGKQYVTSSYPVQISSASIFPHFAAGGLFRTEFRLFAPLKTTVHGVLQFFDDDGKPVGIAVGAH